MYRTVWHHLVGSLPPTPDARQWPITVTSLENCHPDTAAMCVVNRGEHEWVTHLFVPLICCYMFCFGVCLVVWVKGSWASQGDSLKHQASEWAGTQPVTICDHDPRPISVHRGPLSYHKIPTFSVLQAKAFLMQTLIINGKTVTCPVLYMSCFFLLLLPKNEIFFFLSYYSWLISAHRLVMCTLRRIY